jgi:hypothetical protein
MPEQKDSQQPPQETDRPFFIEIKGSNAPEYLKRFFEKYSLTLSYLFSSPHPFAKLAIFNLLGKIKDFFPEKKEDFREAYGILQYVGGKLFFFFEEGEYDEVSADYILNMVPQNHLERVDSSSEFFLIHTHPKANYEVDKQKLDIPEQFSTADLNCHFDLTSRFAKLVDFPIRNNTLPALYFLVIHPSGYQIILTPRDRLNYEDLEKKDYRIDSSYDLLTQFFRLHPELLETISQHRLQEVVSFYLGECFCYLPEVIRNALGKKDSLSPNFLNTNPYEKEITQEEEEKIRNEEIERYKTENNIWFIDQNGADLINQRVKKRLEELRYSGYPKSFHHLSGYDQKPIIINIKDEKSFNLLPQAIKDVFGYQLAIFNQGENPVIRRDKYSPKRIFPLSSPLYLHFRDQTSGIVFLKQKGGNQPKPLIINVDNIPMTLEIMGIGRWQSEELLDEGFSETEGLISKERTGLIFQLDPRVIASYSFTDESGVERNVILRYSYLNPEAEALYRLNLIMENADNLPQDFLRWQLQEILTLLEKDPSIQDRRGVNGFQSFLSMFLALKIVKGGEVNLEKIKKILELKTIDDFLNFF